MNFLSYLTGIRMEKAKQLLLATALPIAEISAQSGYGDYRVFTKVFKKSEGVTPSQYRRDFLEKGYYAPFAQAVAAAAVRHLAGREKPVLLDAGCGEGYYTAALAEALAPQNSEILAVDISKFAADKCAKRCKDVRCAVASVYHLPVGTESCDGVVSLFAPYCGEEYRRVQRG